MITPLCVCSSTDALCRQAKQLSHMHLCLCAGSPSKASTFVLHHSAASTQSQAGATGGRLQLTANHAGGSCTPKT